MSSLLLLGAGLSNRIASPAVVTRPIEQMAVGQRVLTENPTGDVDHSLGEVDAKTWKQIVLRLDRPDGTWSELTLIRPEWWLTATHGGLPQPNDILMLDLPELDCTGPATVVSVRPCPTPDQGSGQVVTGVFRHSAAEVLDLAVEDTEEVIGATSQHPFWSEDRAAWVAAGQLRVGEKVQTLAGPKRVTGIAKRETFQSTFNLEVARDHTFRVASSGILVHNASHASPLGRAMQEAHRLWDRLADKNGKLPKNVERGKVAAFIHKPTGACFFGYSQTLRDELNRPIGPIHVSLFKLWPNASEQRWPLGNCAEDHGLNRLFSWFPGAKRSDIAFAVLDLNSLSPEKPCKNCRITTRGMSRR